LGALEIFSPFDDGNAVALFVTSAAMCICHAILKWARLTAVGVNGKGMRFGGHDY
jgi:hypothetical protein